MQVSDEMKDIVKDEVKFYEYGQSLINKDPKTYDEMYTDPHGCKVRYNNNFEKGFLGYHTHVPIKTLKYG